MIFFSTPPRDPRSAAFSLSTPPSSSPPTSHHAASTQPPSPPAAASSLHRQPCFATRSFPSQLHAASSRRSCIGVAGRELPQGSRPLRAFSSHSMASASTSQALPPPPPLVNQPGFQYERVPSLDEILGDKEAPLEDPKPSMENTKSDDGSTCDNSYTITRFANDIKSSVRENCARKR